MTFSKRAGHDLISGLDLDSREVCFTDGTIEQLPRYGHRRLELIIATSHPAIRDVHVGSPVTATTCIGIETTRECDRDEVIGAAQIAARRTLPNRHVIRVMCFDWT